MASGANHSRPTSMTYPSGRALSYTYASGLDDAISRLTRLSDSTDTLEGYLYLGLDTAVTRYRSSGLGGIIHLTYVSPTGAPGEGGDWYAGLDRFGRVVDQWWIRPTADRGGITLDRHKYGYDRGGDVLYRQDVVNAAFSELYHANGAAQGYDLLGQLTAFRRGTLSDTNADGVPDTVATATRSLSWDFDSLGNFESVTSDGTAQSRAHNAQNETTGVGAATLAYDNNGALASDEQGRTLKYDAWGRLVEVRQGAAVLASYSHDALGRRVLEGSRALYYSASWQVIEEREGGVVRAQTVFSPVYVDDIVLRTGTRTATAAWRSGCGCSRTPTATSRRCSAGRRCPWWSATCTTRTGRRRC
jgi:hypothetical protein